MFLEIYEMKKLFFQFAVVAAFGLMMSETATAQSITGTDTFVGINETNTSPQPDETGTNFSSPFNAAGRWSSASSQLTLVDSDGVVVPGAGNFEANATDVDLTTTLSGLADGTYEIGLVYGSAFGPPNYSANLNGGSDITLGSAADSIEPDFDYEISFISAFRTILGTATVSGGNDIEINIETDPDSTSTNRNTLNGVTFELVGGSTVPEPSSLALLGLGGLVGLTRRRR